MIAKPLTDAFLERVARSYNLALASSRENDEKIWIAINGLRQPIHDILVASDLPGLRSIFGDPIRSNLFYGVDNLALSIEESITDPSSFDEGMAAVVKDQILSLAHALALIRWVPVGTEYHQHYRSSDYATPQPLIEDLLGSISIPLGATVSFPAPFPGERGLETRSGLATYRAVHAIYQAVRLRQELRSTQRKSVLEIGPGMGRTAFYAVQAGIGDYVTIDLPLGVVAQACFLGATLGPDAIWMVGDDMPADGRIRLLPSSSLDDLDERFGVVMNVDSITEMGPATAATYACWIAAHAEVFLSINHEGNRATVAALAAQEFSAAEYRRFPYWLRPAYVEELFALAEPSQPCAPQPLGGRLSSWLARIRQL